MQKTTTEIAELEVFIPGPGENPDDPDDAERAEFLDTAQKLLESGLDIAVYSTDSYPSAFEECVPVAEQIEIAGYDVLPILLADGDVKVSYNYPDAEQLQRFSKARSVKQKKVSAAAAACGGSAVEEPRTVPGQEPAGFAAVLAGVKEKPAGGPAIGNRVNLMGGDFGDGIPQSGSVARKDAEEQDEVSEKSGGCGCGGCGCS